MNALHAREDNELLFKPLSFTLNKGHIVLLHGPNGVGKTTCLRTLAGLLQPAHGKIFWRNQLLKPYNPQYLASMIYLAHHAGIKGVLTPIENLHQYLTLAGSQTSMDAIKNVLMRVGLSRQSDITCNLLSSGQQRRVNLARLLLANASLWILDEPLTALDKQGMELVNELLTQHAAQGGCVILTSHHHLSIATETVELESYH